jgi:hypothetical protein
LGDQEVGRRLQQIREGNAARIREVTEALSVGLGDADIHLNGSFRA